MYGIEEGTMWNEPYRGKGIAMKEPCREQSKKTCRIPRNEPQRELWRY
jgi:hypothetical protein